MICPECFDRDFTVRELTWNKSKWVCSQGHETNAYYFVNFTDDDRIDPNKSPTFSHLTSGKLKSLLFSQINLAKKDRQYKKSKEALLQQQGLKVIYE